MTTIIARVEYPTIKAKVDRPVIRAKVQQPRIVCRMGVGLPGPPGNVIGLLDSFPDYPNDETAAADGYMGKYYFIGGVDSDGNASDIGPAGMFKKRLDI